MDTVYPQRAEEKQVILRKIQSPGPECLKGKRHVKSKHVGRVTCPGLGRKTAFRNTSPHLCPPSLILPVFPPNAHTAPYPLQSQERRGALGSHGRLSANLVQEMPTFPAWPRSRRPLAKFSRAMGHSALGTNALSRSFMSTQQGAAGKARIWRLSFFRAATASLHLEDTAPYHHCVLSS